MKKMTRILALLLVLCMAVSMLPAAAFAAESVKYSLDTSVGADAPGWTVDKETKGSWIGTYGTDGYVLSGWESGSDIEELPYYIDSIEYFGVERSGTYVGRNASSQGANTWWAYGLAHPEAPDGTRKIAYRHDDGGLCVRINANDKLTHQLTFYSVAENDPGRQQSVQAFDPVTGEAISQISVNNDLPHGTYITLDFSGSVDIWFNNDAYDPPRTNIIINGIFFDSKYEPGEVPLGQLFVGPEDGEIVRTDTDPFQMTFTTMPVNATDRAVTWSVTEGGEFASIDDEGMVTVKAQGAFTVRVQSVTDPDIFDEITITTIGTAPGSEGAELFTIGDRHAGIQNKFVRLLMDLDTGYYSIFDQESGEAVVLNSYFQVNDQKSTDGYSFGTSELTRDEESLTLRITGIKEGENDLILDVKLEHGTGDIFLAAGLTNRSGEGVKVMQMYPINANYNEKGGVFIGPDPKVNHAVLTGDAMYNTAQVKKTVSTTSRNNLIISYREEPALEAFLIGQFTTYSFQSLITSDFNSNSFFLNDGRKSIDMNIRIYDNTGKLVDAGDTYVGDIALINFTTDNPYDSLEDYADRQADFHNVELIGFDPYIYECLWYVDWNTPGANNADFAVQEVKDLYEKGMANYAIPSIRVEPDTYTWTDTEQLWWDDEHWLAFGHLTETYPTVKQWLAAMREAGGEGGLYMQASYRSNDYCELYPGQMINNDYREGPDYTDPDFEAHMAEVYANLKDAGLTSLFFDYAGQYKRLNTATGKWNATTYLLDRTGGFEDPYATTVEAYRKIFEFPKKYIGSDVRITENSIEYTGNDLCIGLIDIQRCVLDTNKFTPAIAANGINQWYRHRTTKLIYADTKVFENKDVTLRRAQITGTGFFFGKTTLGESVNLMSDEKIRDVGKIVPFPVDGVAARPVGLFEQNYDINPEVYDYAFENGQDDHILLFWNQGTAAKDISANLGGDTAFGGVGLNPDAEYEIWDFWNWQYIGRVKGSDTLTLNVQGNEMKTLAVRALRAEPFVLSTNRHVLQGTKEIDVPEFSYDAQTHTIEGAFNIVGNDTYKAVISLGDNELILDGFSFDNEAVTGKAEMIVENNQIQIILSSEENQTVPFEIKLKEGTMADDTVAPPAVESLSAAADGLTGLVTLSWDESIDDNAFVQVKYDVYGSAEAGELGKLLATLTEPGFTDTVAHNGFYYYNVVVRDGAGNESAPASVTTQVEKTANPAGITMTAGNHYSSQTAAKAVDGNEASIWHTDWNGTDRKNMWLDMEFASPTEINRYAYLPRNDASTNGTIMKFQLQGSADGGKTYELITEGEWPNRTGWKVVEFETMTLTNIRLIAVTSASADENEYASAAEVKAYLQPTVDTLVLSETELTLEAGETAVLTCGTFPINADPTTITWSSSDESVATVTDGVVTAVAEGTTVITATAATGAECSCTVTVEAGPVKVTGVTLNETTCTAQDGVSFYLEAIVEPANAANQEVLWTVSDESIVSIDNDGDGLGIMVNTLKAGTATITVTTADGGFTASCEVTVICPSSEFNDVDLNEWFHSYIDSAVRMGLMNGNGDGTFGPNDSMTRAMLVQVLYNQAGRPAVTTESKFPDVTRADWFHNAVVWASEKGYVLGYDNGCFGPEDKISRQDLVTIMFRHYGGYYPTENVKLDFIDVDEIADYALDPVKFATAISLVMGDPDGRFRPSDSCTRAEAAKILYVYFMR